jgi:AcrR family transcriptional regulator
VRTPLQNRSSVSAGRMLEATLELVEHGGLQAVTVAEVARRSGTSNGSLYHRFGDRTGLLLAAQDRALSAIEQATGAAFARASAEPDDDRAIALLVRAALDIFAEHRGAMRAFLAQGQGDDRFEERNVRSSHLIARTVIDWLRQRFDTPRTDAEATYRILFALGATHALFEDRQVSPGPLSRTAFAEAVTRAVGAIARP